MTGQMSAEQIAYLRGEVGRGADISPDMARDLLAEIDLLRLALDRVRSLHVPIRENGTAVGCGRCDWAEDGEWPCATIRALAEEPPA